MKTIYSILYVPINATLDERVSIGMIMSDGIHHIFKYSQAKLTAIKGLLDPENYNVLKIYLRSLEKEINSEAIDHSVLFHIETKAKWVNTSYISYLSRYSNNLLQFSEPKYIDVELNKNIYKRLFEKNIFLYEEETIDSKPQTSVFEKVKNKLYPRIEGKVNFDKILTSDDFENLFAPVEVNFIGINGVPVAGQTFDFEKTHYYLESDITRFISLTKALELSGKPDGKYFVIGKEPKRNNKNHQMWAQIRDTNFLDFVDVNEMGAVEEYIIKRNVTPFFENIAD